MLLPTLKEQVCFSVSFSQGCKNTFSLAGTFVNVCWRTINVPTISGRDGLKPVLRSKLSPFKG